MSMEFIDYHNIFNLSPLSGKKELFKDILPVINLILYS